MGEYQRVVCPVCLSDAELITSAAQHCPLQWLDQAGRWIHLVLLKSILDHNVTLLMNMLGKIFVIKHNRGGNLQKQILDKIILMKPHCPPVTAAPHYSRRHLRYISPTARGRSTLTFTEFVSQGECATLESGVEWIRAAECLL